jgi:hypothetical protein
LFLFQEVQRNRQVHLRETANFEAPHAEQDPWRESLMKKLECILLAMHSPGKPENKVEAARGIGGRQPGQAPKPAESRED